MRLLDFVRVSCALIVGVVPAIAFAQTKVTLRTDYKVNGYVAPFALALERGFYREQGLTVEIEQGQGSSVTVQTVAAGDDTFGLADSTAMVVGISSKSIPVKAIYVFSQTGIQGFAYHPESGWDGSINGMRHKVFVGSPGSAELSVLPAILATAGMTVADLDLQLVDSNAKVPLFIKTPGSFMAGYATGDMLRIRSKMPNLGFAPFSKYGITAYGTAVITKNATIQSNPELVRKFVAASAKGWQAAAKDPEAAVQAAVKLFPDVDPKLLLGGLKIVISDQLHTPATAGKPIGWTAESDWKAMLNMLEKYSQVNPKPVSTYFTNKFIAQP
jgi:NitT/TauT family transport system substrate-binding protein